MLNIDAVHYRYRRSRQASLQNVSLQVRPGTCCGLLGPNGAGKTTLISLIAGLLPVQQGSIQFAGQPLDAARRAQPTAIALVPQDYAFYPMLTVRENLSFFAGVQGVAASERRQRMAQALAFCQLEQVADQLARELSGGLRRRLNLAIGLLGDPQLLLLDEPTVGVDPQSRHFLLDAIRALCQAANTVIYTSHYMDEVEALCDTVAIIDHGRVLLQGDLQQVLRQARQELELQLAQPLPEALLAAWQQQHALVAEGPARYRLTLEAGRLADLLQTLAAQHCEVLALAYGQQNLEHIFMQLTQRALRDKS